jgi:hypothetical protein
MKEKERSLKALRQALRSVVGLTCSEVVAGWGVGTAVLLEFGQVVRVQRRETKRGLRESKIFESSIFVQDATWRVENDTKVICCTAADDNSPKSKLVLGLNKMLKQRVVSAELSNTAFDLSVQFGNGLRFLVFSVPLTAELNENNYSILTSDTSYSVGFDGSVAVECRDDDDRPQRQALPQPH